MNLVLFPAPILRRVAKPLLINASTCAKIDAPTRAKIDDMFAIQRSSKDAGLAAPQVDWDARVFVAGDRVYLNPEIIYRGDKLASGREGCLSLPGVFVTVCRPAEVTIRHYDLRDGVWISERLGGLSARVAQHEIDHLDGILIIDRIGAAARALVEKKLRKLVERKA